MYGLILEGGGARGAYHIGAYKALVEEEIEIDGVAGTSIGALNGAMIVQGDHEKAYEIWHEISYSKIIVANDKKIEKLREMNLDMEDISALLTRVKDILYEKGLDITPLKNLISKYIDEDKIRNSGKDFGLVTFSLTDFKPVEIYIEDIPVGELAQYIMASAYLPVFKNEMFDGKRYIDGGVYNNLPVNLLKDKGYQNLIIVRTNAVGTVKKFDLEGLNIITISPNESLGRTFDLDIETVRHNLQLGYFDGLKAIKVLQGHNYYIEPVSDTSHFVNHLLSLEKEKVLQLGSLLNTDENIPYKRALFEQLIPKLAALLGVDKEADYDSIFYTLLEKLADIYSLERFEVYAYDNLVALVRDNLETQEATTSGIIGKIIKKVDVLSVFNKEEIIKEVGKIIL